MYYLYPAYTLKYNKKRKKQVILLIIIDEITSNHHGDFIFIHTQHIINLKNMKEYAIIMITAVWICLQNMKK